MRSALAFVVAISLGIAGCQEVQKDDRANAVGVPEGAMLVEQGEGKLEYEPTDDGTIFVYDAEREALLYRDKVKEGDEFEIDPENNRIQVNEKTVHDRPLSGKKKHRKSR